MHSLKALQERIKATTPGSPEERAVLEQTRAIKRATSTNFSQIKTEELGRGMNDAGVVSPEIARKAGEQAMQHITGEHQVVNISSAQINGSTPPSTESVPTTTPVSVNPNQQPL